MKTKPNTPTKTKNISISNYQELAMGTCLKTCKNKDYWHFGIKSEICELIGKVEGLRAKKIRGDEITQDKIDAIKDEIGDVFWFAALGCALFAKKGDKNAFARVYKLTDANVQKEALLVHSYSLDEELYIYRLDEEFYIHGLEVCALYISTVKRIAAELGIKPYDCLVRNIKKLYSRKERGVIKGDGDKR